ncbi:MAG: hydroxymethylbilane synthase [Saprospiraceae bacterium]|nr:hydroxymethylbilane synthase [Saprospiraceae bacterium]
MPKKQVLKKIRIGTPGNTLGIWQANLVKEKLEAQSFEVELAIFNAKDHLGNRLESAAFEERDSFAAKLGAALLRGDVDLAVNYLKELPTTQPEGLVIAGVSHRENPADVLLIRSEAIGNQLFKLKLGAVVGASSTRQKAQLLSYRPDLNFLDIHGEVPSQLEELRNADCDAILIAAADLTHFQLNLDGLTVVNLHVREFVPAPAQGVFAYQCCKEDIETRNIIKQYLHTPAISAVTNVERKVMKMIEGGCHLPLGVYCERDHSGNYQVWAALADAWDLPVRRVRLSQSTHLGLAERVLDGLLDPATSNQHPASSNQ